MPKTQNIFHELNLDLSDFVLKNNMMRNARNIRIIDLESSTFAVTGLKGTEVAFDLSTDSATSTPYIPMAAETYNNVLYIFSYNIAASKIEIGSFPSTAGDVYQPFQNLDGGAFTVDQENFMSAAFSETSDLKMELQFDYDESVNVILVTPDDRPRIINSKFKWSNGSLVATDARPGDANSNEYTTSSLEKESRLILATDKLLKIDFDSIIEGGTLKAGNYQYVFAYMTEDLNPTDVTGESSICAVFPGSSIDNISASEQGIETTKMVRLSLTNVDTDFRYLKVWMRFTPGDSTRANFLYEFVSPLEITGSSMTFSHTGYEKVNEVDFAQINTLSSGIIGANTAAQLNGYLLLGGVKETEADWSTFASAAQTITPAITTEALTYSGDASGQGYLDPYNIYYKMGHFRGETYPFGVVYIMNDGSLSPVFPTRGGDFYAGISDLNDLCDKGLVRFPAVTQSSYTRPTSLVGTSKRINPMRVTFNTANVPDAIKDQTLGFFFVRGERRPDMLAQGAVIPTLKVPPIEYVQQEKYYYDDYLSDSDYVHLPCVSRILEAYGRDATNDSDDDTFTVILNDEYKINYLNIDSAGNPIAASGVPAALRGGYMPIYVNDINTIDGVTWPVDIHPDDHWALLSGDAIADQARYVAYLTRDDVGVVQLGRITTKVRDPLADVFHDPSQSHDGGIYLPYDIGLNFDFLSTTYNTENVVVADSKFVPAETFATGHEFVSKIVTRLHIFTTAQSKHMSHDISQAYNPYFGLKLSSGNFTSDGKTEDGPRRPLIYTSSIERWVSSHPYSSRHTSSTQFNNIGDERKSGYIVNVYPRSTGLISDINNLYPTIDSVIYKQVSPRYTWAEATTANDTFDIYGGDCYITKFSRKLNQSGLRDPNRVYNGIDQWRNIDSGMLYSWMQESEYNGHLRLPVQQDAAELEKRSFFPFQSDGNFTSYRRYRLPETTFAGLGYSETLRSKSYFALSDETIVLRNNFFSRVAHSAKHQPNSYQNGYRVFSGVNYQDYDASMGRIVYMTAHRGKLFIVFEHGMAITEVEQRILTGQDIAGSVFVEPKGVLPPVIGFISREIGSQHSRSIIQTPYAVYGQDLHRQKIWMFTDKLTPISDASISSWLKANPPSNPVSGYDPQYNEVIFASDSWALCFKEGLDKFTSFYDYSGDLFARKGTGLYSFTGNVCYKHNSDTTYSIYGNAAESYIEFVINEAANMAKVFDHITVISNEVRPSKIEWFTYPYSSKRFNTIVSTGTGQYASVSDTTDTARQENQIRFRDKKFVSQVPNAEFYNSALDEWNQGGRMRNKYIIVRLTYSNMTYDKPLQLLSVITDYRISKS